MGIENIHDLKKIREIKTKYGFSPKDKLELEKKIFEKIGQNEQVVANRIEGIEAEDEFFLLLISIAKVEQITRLEQKQLINYKKYTVPDYLISVSVPSELQKDKTQPLAQRMFIEVKKCKKGEFEFIIPKETYKKLRFYTMLYTLPLYFAVKFDAPNINNWFLISGETLEKFAKSKRLKVNGKKQECYCLEVGEVLKRDMSGFWFDNFMILLQKGTIITKVYERGLKNPLTVHPQYGALKSHKFEYNGLSFEKDFSTMKDSNEKIISSSILQKLSNGEESTISKGNKTEVILEVDNNYFIPFYEIIFGCYLNLRKQFKVQLGDTDDTIEYYLNNFKDFDKSLIGYIHKFYREILSSNILKQIKMMPNLE